MKSEEFPKKGRLVRRIGYMPNARSSVHEWIKAGTEVSILDERHEYPRAPQWRIEILPGVTRWVFKTLVEVVGE